MLSKMGLLENTLKWTRSAKEIANIVFGALLAVIMLSRTTVSQKLFRATFVGVATCLMLFETLHQLRSKADRMSMYPSEWSVSEGGDSSESRMLRHARDHYGVKLRPIGIQIRPGSDGE